MNEVEVYSVPMAAPDDVSEVRKLLDSGAIDANHVAVVIAQTEGDGFARGYSALNLQLLLAERQGVSRQDIFDTIPLLMIGGTAGMMCPHFTLFVSKPGPRDGDPSEKRLVLGVDSTPPIPPENYGRMAQAGEVEAAVRRAMESAGLDDPADVRCVELKVPQMTPARIQDAQSRGKTVCNPNPVVASGMSRGASALGAALALGEVEKGDLSDAVIGVDSSLYSNIASASSGSEQVACRVVVIGNAAGSPSRFVAGNGVMENQLDLKGARTAFANAGLKLEDGMLPAAEREKIAAVFINAGANYVPDILGRRHTMTTDLMAAWAGHQAKAVAHAIVSSIVGDTLILANAGAEHQGKPGANLVCVIAEA